MAVAVDALWMFQTARARVPRLLLEQSGGSELCWLPVLSFVAIHPTEGAVLIDAGMPSKLERFTQTAVGTMLSRF
ncbi:MAG: hypothetical protein KC561_12930, partial [Myxococcales bacterium]|nr:hypothetical protein [Myxococcales bacterium]